MATVINAADRLQEKSVGDQILITNLGLSWQSLGYTLVLRVKLGSGASRDLALSAVIGQPLQAFRNTSATDFPSAGDYKAQIIGIKAGIEERFSSVVTISIEGNL